MTPLSDERIAEIRAREQAATPVTWTITQMLYPCIVDEGDTGFDVRATGEGASWGAHCDAEADADFIAHARQDVSDLLAEVERLRAERRWIPVGERLPDDERLPADDSPVLVLCHIDGHEPWVEVRASCDLPSYATHWQPLPPLPEDAE